MSPAALKAVIIVQVTSSQVAGFPFILMKFKCLVIFWFFSCQVNRFTQKCTTVKIMLATCKTGCYTSIDTPSHRWKEWRESRITTNTLAWVVTVPCVKSMIAPFMITNVTFLHVDNKWIRQLPRRQLRGRSPFNDPAFNLRLIKFRHCLRSINQLCTA